MTVASIRRRSSSGADGARAAALEVVHGGARLVERGQRRRRPAKGTRIRVVARAVVAGTGTGAVAGAADRAADPVPTRCRLGADRRAEAAPSPAPTPLPDRRASFETVCFASSALNHSRPIRRNS
jgi:hypothetical protein